MTQINNEEIVLPAIQRPFVWNPEQIEKLFDSILRGYPIGMILLWETYDNIQFRMFDKTYRSDNLPKFYKNTNFNKRMLVIDGQQRLQSIYLGLYGSHDGTELFFDVLGNSENGNSEDIKYWFEFLTHEKEINYEKDAKNIKKDEEKFYFVKVKDILDKEFRIRRELKIIADLKLNTTETKRLRSNIKKVEKHFNNNNNILTTSIVDEKLKRDNPARMNNSDILEIFARINQQGTRLEKSDLTFSFLVLGEEKLAEVLPDFVKKINRGNAFDLDNVFVMRCLFAVSHLGTKFNYELLKNPTNYKKVINNFNQCCKAIESSLDFITKHCGISNSRALGGNSNFIPIVYYLFHTQKHMVPKSQTSNLRKLIFLFGFTKPFSRYADSRLWKFIKEELKPIFENNRNEIPFKNAIEWIMYWEKVDGFNDNLLNRNHLLVHYLVQGLSSNIALYDKNNPQMDHIFPRSKLYEHQFKDNEINHFANFWILEQEKNQNKPLWIENP